jgi:hypothetical protein
METKNIYHIEWDTFIKNMSFKANWNPVNLTWSEVKFTIKRGCGTEALVTQIATIIDAVNGICKIQINSWMPWVGNYIFDIQYTDTVGVIRTLLSGGIYISKQVTT